MGALHEGHFSLIDAARARCGFVVVSIFVNPTQFGPNEDLSKYPRPLETDLAGCRRRGVDVVFVPEVETMYPAGAGTTVHVARLGERMCGAARPGHFDGVCTVVAKLFNIVGADLAFFGAKDYQQAAIIRKMVVDLDMPVAIEVCPTVRETDGLAMSSRNAYLDDDQRRQATALSEALTLAAGLVRLGRTGTQEIVAVVTDHIAQQAPLGRLEYVEVVDPDTLAPLDEVKSRAVVALAVKFPSARLIDNTSVSVQNHGRKINL
jgi:pantoate--beta-alanine ligase